MTPMDTDCECNGVWCWDCVMATDSSCVEGDEE